MTVAEGVTRRRFIWLGGAGVAGAGAIAAGAVWWRGHGTGPDVHPDVVAKLRALAPAEHATLAAAVETLTAISTLGIPAPPPGAPSAADLAALHLDGFVADGPEADRADVHSLLWLVEHGPFVLQAGASRFTRLAPDRRDAYLRGWALSSIALLRTGFRVLKQMAAVGTYRVPETWPALRYGGPQVERGWDIEEHGG